MHLFLGALVVRGYLGTGNGTINDASGAVASMRNCSGYAVSSQKLNKFDVVVDRLVGHFGHWDGVYFARIARCGYENEQEHAFFPGYPLAIRSVSAVFSKEPSRQVIVLSGFIVSNAAFVVAAIFLYSLTKAVFSDELLSRASALLFCFNPASIFMSSVYTESLFALFAFGGMFLFENNAPLLGVAFFTCATGTRSNGIILVAYAVYHIIIRCPVDAKALRGLISRFLMLSIAALVISAPYVAFEVYGRQVYCTSNDPRPWCSEGSMYAFVQRHYWNNGFLRYYVMKQVPNFLLASFVFFSAASCTIASFPYFHEIVANFSHDTSTKGLHYATGSLKSQLLRPGRIRSLVYIVHLFALTLFAALFMHVQVTTRFLMCQCPLYWSAARAVLAGGRSRYIFVIAFAAYTVVGVLMFTNFYPWT